MASPEEVAKRADTASGEKTEKEVSETQEKKPAKPEGPLLVQEELIPFLTEYGKENPEDKIRIKTRFGNIDVQLFHDTPLHRANLIFLVKHDYFDKTFFHRVADGFVVQGGNSDMPSTNKKRHYIGDYLIPSEFDAGHKHVRGAFSAAKYAEQNVSKASHPYEFFIVQSETGAHHLNNEHTVFGRVIDGMDVVDEISKVKTDGSEWPLQNIYLDVEILD
jgi:peptidylprolyl isomerase